MTKTLLIFSSIIIVCSARYGVAQTEIVSPTGKAPVDHSPLHIGLDLEAKPGEEITSPIQGEVASIVTDVLTGTNWTGLVIKGTGADKNVTLRVLGIATTLKVNTTLLELLDMEGECSPQNGKIPNPKLGVIAACRSKDSTGILRFNLGHNSEAYKNKKSGEIFY